MENILENILESDKQAGEILAAAREKQDAIAKDTLEKKGQIEDQLKADTAAMMARLAAEHERDLAAQAAASDAAFAEKKAAMERHCEQNKAAWRERVMNALLAD